MFVCKIRELSEKEIEDGVVRTRKLQSQYAECHVPKDVSDAARIIQSIQVCYDESTSKVKPRFTWKESIESKISKILCFIDLLEKTVRQEKVSSSQKKVSEKLCKKELTLKNFEEAQLEKLYYEIDKRKLHSKLYNVRNNELLRVSDSSGWGNASVGVFKRAEMHEEPTLPLKQASNDEECVKHLKT
ncbi:hypothetical protein CWI36_0091p0030 [Hamiltosporidium magnivora]|uniref:Uncharacterized protein n=1 Tax=Hamiltosporidium magnivora TaxID=148818 RepID=A0A4V2JWQ6_9MICR|nr:hypothetical protein CWI36_0091p0030 [Hamiltosporidium magnivora]